MAALCPSVRWSLKVSSEWSIWWWVDDEFQYISMNPVEKTRKNTVNFKDFKGSYYIMWFSLWNVWSYWMLSNVVYMVTLTRWATYKPQMKFSGEFGRTAMWDAAERRWQNAFLPLGLFDFKDVQAILAMCPWSFLFVQLCWTFRHLQTIH